MELKPCPFCHKDRDGCVAPIEENCHAFIQYPNKGVYIDMEMPKDTIFCPCMDRETGYCQVPGVAMCYGHGNSGCPLVPVPPHGRLIDADALIENGGEYEHPIFDIDGSWDDIIPVISVDTIKKAITIIPAEEGNE